MVASSARHNPTATITGVVYNDANANGVQDSGEAGLAGWTVYIDIGNTGSFANGDPYVYTDNTGTYTFTGLAAGNYITRVIANSGYDTIQGASGWAPNAIAGQTTNGGPFGETQVTGTLVGVVYDDRNGDGVQEANEAGIQNWPVYIDLNNSGQYVTGDPYVYTDSYGGYSFPGLQPGTYTIRAVPGNGWSPTQGTNGWTATVIPNQTSPGGNFGEY